VNPEGTKGGDDVTFGLEWPEPLATFALSCGSWSSPAVIALTKKQYSIICQRPTVLRC
jgi:hypothetical protein